MTDAPAPEALRHIAGNVEIALDPVTLRDAGMSNLADSLRSIADELADDRPAKLAETFPRIETETHEAWQQFIGQLHDFADAAGLDHGQAERVVAAARVWGLRQAALIAADEPAHLAHRIADARDRFDEIRGSDG